MKKQNRFIGDRAFYGKVMSVMLPIMVQGAFTNFVNMLDNLMVGRVGTLEMTGTSVANQFIFIMNICIFGLISGAGIFSAQFHGSGNTEGVRNAFRFKLLSGTVVISLCIAALYFGGDALVDIYLKGEAAAGEAEITHAFARQYLNIILIGLIPYTWSQCLFSSMRETGHATPPMVAGVIAVLVNLGLNYVLIFGHFGAPRLGVKGAAIATVISRYVEILIVIFWGKTHPERFPFLKGALRHFRIPGGLVKQILIKGLPLAANESLWAVGCAFVDQCYSLKGLIVVSAQNIVYTFFDVVTIAFTSCGSAAGIIIGQLLGSGKTEEAKDSARKLIVLSTAIGFFVGALFVAFSGIMPKLYNTGEDVQQLAADLMRILAIIMPPLACYHACYFIIRSGGRTFITMLTDCGYVWLLQIPIAYYISRFTDMPIEPFYLLIQCLMFVKVTVCLILIKKDIWVRNIVEK